MINQKASVSVNKIEEDESVNILILTQELIKKIKE
jgi:vacuolar-type H+-ATPase subunit F/Vma7